MKKLLLSVFIVFGLATVSYSQPVCGGTFTDPAGATSNYANSADYTVTILPTNPGDLVTVTFTSFNTEAVFDVLYVFNGNSITSPQISSGNPIGNTPWGLAGGYYGTTIPGPFTSTDSSGALTFRFRSDSSANFSGWIANVTCAPPPTCVKPTLLTTSSISSNSATLGWTENNAATSWEVIVVPCGAPAPISTSVGEIVTINPYVKTGLSSLTCYDFYVRSVCSPTDSSVWAGPKTFTSLPAQPICGGQFTDVGGFSASYPNNSDSTVTICPNIPNSILEVIFTSFSTEATWDALYVFDGNSIASPQIASANGAGNVPGGLAGGYWGSAIPGPFTSTDPSGCLTFRFRSDGSGQNSGWAADVNCIQQNGCLRPTILTASSTSTTATISWTENNSATSWEVLYLPCGSPTPTTQIGQLVTNTTTTIFGLASSTCYDIYVRSNCSLNTNSIWAIKTVLTSPINDECIDAILLTLNTTSCSEVSSGTLTGATASTSIPVTTCLGTPDDDVWFKFVATNPDVVFSFPSSTGSTNNFNMAIYSGNCGALNQISCASSVSNLIEGNTYYVRVYSNSPLPQTVNFTICASTFSNCVVSQSVCGLTTYVNSVGISSIGTIGCLLTTPNPTYFNLRVAQTGPINLQLSQTDFTGNGRDVDYAAWGPFTSKAAACDAISSGQQPGIGVPLSITTGCSFSAAPTELLNITNAVAGEFYIVLITNYSNQPGFISLTQTNEGAPGAGALDCSGIQLKAFVDTNNNGTQDNGEINFPLGQFQYTINASATIHNITTPSGIYTLYDDFSANSYTFNYIINPELSALYTSSATYSNVLLSSGGTYNFPIISLQNYNDIGVTLVPLSSPRAGTTYQNKIVYTNNGNQTIASGTLSFDKNPAATITTISQTGTFATPNGFTYSFTNLLPFESRSIFVTMSVPAIPTVSLGQLLTNTVAITPVSGDYISNNNSSTLTQVVTGSYDPNDKSESHGGKIQFSSFTDNDYLYYTIRFENTGTASAINIRVTDLLNNDLDENSLVMINASHNYALDRVDKSLVWNFNNIQLPVSVANTTIGKGYINFKIKPKAGYAVGDIIPNTASIYFDNNPAIITNTFTTEFVQSLNINDYDFANLYLLSPIPAKQNLTITTKQDVLISSISIYNVLGQLIQVNTNPNETIDVSGLKTGNYFIKIISDKGTASSKFIKQ